MLVDTPVPALRFSVIHSATSFSSSGNAAERPRRARLLRGVSNSFSRQRRTQLSSTLNCFPAARFPLSVAKANTLSLKDAVYDALGEPLSDMMLLN